MTRSKMEAGESSFIFSSETPFISGELTEIMPLESRTASDSPFRMLRAKRYGRWVALKALKPEYVGNPFYEGILAKEFSIGYGLQHNGIARTLGFVALPDVGNAIESDYVDGVTLREYIAAHKPLAREEVRRIAGELCEAVGYLHSRGVTHRDLKPDNIMIESQTGLVKLIDFGCADTPDFAILKSPAGTLRYAAPEQFDAGKEANPQADIYAIGVVFSDLLMAAKHADSRLRRIARRCMQPEGRRYAAVGDISRALFRKSRRGVAALSAVVLLALSVGIAGVVGVVREKATFEQRVAEKMRVDSLAERRLSEDLMRYAEQYSSEYLEECIRRMRDTTIPPEERAKIPSAFAENILSNLEDYAIRRCDGDTLEAKRYLPQMVQVYQGVYRRYYSQFNEAIRNIYF